MEQSFVLPKGKLTTLLTAEQIAVEVARVAKEVSREYEQTGVHLLGVLRGSFVFLADLSRRLTCQPVTIDFVGRASYGAGTTSCGKVKETIKAELPIGGRHVLVVEDIVDTGLTLHALLADLRQENPASLKVAALLDKPSRRKIEVPISYLGFSIPDHFVVGYGLDCAHAFRSLPHVAVFAPEK